METIPTIKKMTREKCLKQLEKAQKDIDFYSSEGRELTDLDRYNLIRARCLVIDLKDDLKMMQEAGRDYVYTVNGITWKYESAEKLLESLKI